MPEAVINKSISNLSSSGATRRCTVQLLDDVAIQIEFKKNDPGSVIFDQVCDHLNLAERDFFGLRFMDHNLHRYWLDPIKPVLKQVKKENEMIVFAFRVKFYPADAIILKEEFTRYLLVLQLRRDLLHGRLHCPQTDLATLAAYIVQAELGDYDPAEHVGNYVSQFKILINQSPRIEEKIAQIHKTLKGYKPADVDEIFLKRASSMDTYGYYPYTIKDAKAGQVYAGATPKGILVYQTSRKLHHLAWSDIESMDYSGKDFFIYPKKSYFDSNNVENKDVSSSSKKKPSLKFICPTSTFSKQMWKYMLAQQAFFTSAKSEQVKPIVKRHLLSRNATFRWYPSNKVLQELKEAQSPKRACPSYQRLQLPRQINRDERSGPWASKFHTMPAKSRNPVSDGELVSKTIGVTVSASTSAEAPELGAAAGGVSFTTTMTPMRPTILNRDSTGDSMAIAASSTPSPSAAASGSKQVSPTTGTGPGPGPDISPIRPSVAAPPNDQVDATAVAVRRRVLHPQSTGIAEDQLTQPSKRLATGETETPTTAHSKTKRRCLYWRMVFLCLLLLAVVFAALIVCMESGDARFKRQLDSWPTVYRFRRNFYDPSRRYVCDGLQKYFKV